MCRKENKAQRMGRAIRCLLFFVFILSACEGPATLDLGRCTDDRDCEEGEVCRDGLCESSEDGDSDRDFDMDDWLETCGEKPVPAPGEVPDCNQYACMKVAPPSCWSCRVDADEEQNGNRCLDPNDWTGFCSDGTCIPLTDGDPDEGADGDEEIPLTACELAGGSCNDYAAACPDESSRMAGDAMGCPGVCCIPLTAVDCHAEGGYCVAVSYEPDDRMPPICEGGYVYAESDEECGLFDSEGAGNWCCLPVEPLCVPEGGAGNTFDPEAAKDHCCPGLDPISNAYPDGNDGCVPATSGGDFFCTRCGNGACGVRENYCNCAEDCAAPGECREDADCPATSCYEIGDWPLMWSCVEIRSKCDVNTGDCKSSEEAFNEWTCNENTGRCEQPVPTVCESENTGVCMPYGRALCPDGMLANGDPLGCEGQCCLEATCLDLGGTCVPNAGSCGEGQSPVAGRRGCPGAGTVCCLPDEPVCVGEGETGYRLDGDPNNDDCCPNLVELSNAAPDNGGNCMAVPDGSFLCGFCGNDVCGPGENYCNCGADCAEPGECTMDAECPARQCTNVNVDPGGQGCMETGYTCDSTSGQCLPSEEGFQGMVCDSARGRCVPPCTEKGEIGMMPDGRCCPGLDTAPYASLDINGQCQYPDCSCFLCIAEGDDLCDADDGENVCNSTDCESPACLTDADCPEADCSILAISGCRINYYECLGGRCVEATADLDSSTCNEQAGHCEPYYETDCERQEGYCSHYLAGCEDGSHDSGSFTQLECPGGRSALCCLPDVLCNDNHDCPDSTCIGFSGLPNCAQISHSCSQDGECDSQETIFEDSFCNEETGYCEPWNGAACQDQGGYCTYFMDGCEEGYGESSDLLGCMGGYSGLCCLPEQNNCVGPDETGMIGGPDCCAGLTSTEAVVQGEDGECYYYDCACFFCIRAEDGFCDRDNNENACNSTDCLEEYCESDSDCPAESCYEVPSGGPLPMCVQVFPSCSREHVCEWEEISAYGEICDSGVGLCREQFYECSEFSGTCVSWMSDCPQGTYREERVSCGDMVCAGGCACCLPYDSP